MGVRMKGMLTLPMKIDTLSSIDGALILSTEQWVGNRWYGRLDRKQDGKKFRWYYPITMHQWTFDHIHI